MNATTDNRLLAVLVVAMLALFAAAGLDVREMGRLEASTQAVAQARHAAAAAAPKPVPAEAEVVAVATVRR